MTGKTCFDFHWWKCLSLLIWKILPNMEYNGMSPSEKNARGSCLSGLFSLINKRVTQNLFVQLLNLNRNYSRRSIKHGKSSVYAKLILKNLLRDTQKYQFMLCTKIAGLRNGLKFWNCRHTHFFAAPPIFIEELSWYVSRMAHMTKTGRVYERGRTLNNDLRRNIIQDIVENGGDFVTVIFPKLLWKTEQNTTRLRRFGNNSASVVRPSFKVRQEDQNTFNRMILS